LSLWWIRKWNEKGIFEGLANDILRYITAGGIAFALALGFYVVLRNFFSFDYSLFDYLIVGLATGIFFCMVWIACAIKLFRNDTVGLISRLTKKVLESGDKA
jgi:hypothetical protein